MLSASTLCVIVCGRCRGVARVCVWELPGAAVGLIGHNTVETLWLLIIPMTTDHRMGEWVGDWIKDSNG